MKTVDVVAPGARLVQTAAIASHLNISPKTIERDARLLKERGVPGFHQIGPGDRCFERPLALWLVYVRLLRQDYNVSNTNGELNRRILQAAQLVVAEETSIEQLLGELPSGRAFIQNPGF